MKARWFAAAITVYLFVLKFVFPGAIRPLSPYHSDFYIPPGLAFYSFWQVLHFPRPAGFLLLQLAGLLGLHGWILVFILIALLNVVAVVRLSERLTGRQAAPAWALLYMFLVLAHPSFYMDYVHDALATASLLYILLAMHAWLSFKETGRRLYLGLCLVLFLLAWTTKETYFLSALVFWGVEAIRARDKNRRAALLALAALAATFVVGMLLQAFSISPFFSPHASPGSAYYINLAPASVAHCWSRLLHALFTPVSLAIVLAALGALWRNRSALLYGGTLFAAGLVALLPNSVLPNHFDVMYAWTGACLVFSPVLFVDWTPPVRRRWRFGASLAVALLLGWASVRANRPGYEHWKWGLEQERSNRNIVRSFPLLKQAPGRHFLVTGVSGPYHPWAVDTFIRVEFGPDRDWTVILPRERHIASQPPVVFVDAAQVDITRFDHAFAYAADGRLLREWNAAELRQLAADGAADRVRLPALIGPLDALAKDPSNWLSLMNVGNVYSEWGQFDQAERYLARSCQANSGRNPYPPYFYGAVEAALGKTGAAIPLFEQAIEMDSKPGNPAFAEALARMLHHDRSEAR
ncbi:MAG: tetratricopeptide repeat protein [Bryobacteraceae bacterium]